MRKAKKVDPLHLENSETLAVQERLMIAMSAVKFGVWDWDLVNGILIWDDYMYQIFDLRKQDFSGAYDAFEKTLIPADAAELQVNLQAAFAVRREVFESEFRIRSTNGAIKFIRASAKCFYNADGTIHKMIGVNWDNTSQKRSEASLVASAKMASLGEMAAGIAHEINNPLAIISARAAQLKERILTGEIEQEEVLRHLTRIEFNSDRISKIIKGLRAFSRNSEGDAAERVSASQIIEDTVELCEQRFIHHGIELRVRILSDATIECRPAQISQVIMNLLGNAFDAVRGKAESWVTLDLDQVGEQLLLKVTDSGLGIAEPLLEKIMQPFFTTKAVGSGTGLGLSISQGICDNHGGSLRYNANSPNTQFVVLLPISAAFIQSVA